MKEQSPIALHCEIVSMHLDVAPETFPVSFSDLQNTNALWHAACFVLQVVLKSQTVEKLIQSDKNETVSSTVPEFASQLAFHGYFVLPLDLIFFESLGPFPIDQ